MKGASGNRAFNSGTGEAVAAVRNAGDRMTGSLQQPVMPAKAGTLCLHLSGSMACTGGNRLAWWSAAAAPSVAAAENLSAA